MTREYLNTLKKCEVGRIFSNLFPWASWYGETKQTMIDKILEHETAVETECKKHVGESFDYNDLNSYDHGRAVKMTITGVKVTYYGVTVLNSLTFEDGHQTCKDSHSMNGSAFLDCFINRTY